MKSTVDFKVQGLLEIRFGSVLQYRNKSDVKGFSERFMKTGGLEIMGGPGEINGQGKMEGLGCLVFELPCK